MSHQGERSVWELILIPSWRQSLPHASRAASSSVPSTQKLVSLKKGVISQSYFPVGEGCKLPCEPCYSNSPTEYTQQLLKGTGFTGSTKAEKSYTFYCRFSVSVLESTAALEADCSNFPSPQDSATNSAPGNSKSRAWFCSADECPREEQTLT